MIGTVVPSFDERYSLNLLRHISHYTNSTTAIEHILYTGKLRLGPIVNTDDPLERIKAVMEFDLNLDFQSTRVDDLAAFGIGLKEKIRSTKIGCFVANRKFNPKQDELAFNRGYFKTRMWSQYGGGNRGICLVFDKPKLLAAVMSQAMEDSRDVQVFSGSVHYTNAAIRQKGFYQLYEKDLAMSQKQFFRKYEKLFFRTKLLDYRDEQEFRIIVVNSPSDSEYIYVDILSSLVGIVVGTDFHPQYFKLIHSFLTKYPGISASRLDWKDGYPRFVDL